MKIVVLDGYTVNPGDLCWDNLEHFGEMSLFDRTGNEEVVERIGDAEIVLTNKTPITRAVMARCKNIKYIGVLATGYDIIDIKAAKENNIIVTNIPTYGTHAVSQFAIALLLELCHHIGEHSRSVKNGDSKKNQDWCYWNYPLIELNEKTMGIIGYGRIGQVTGGIAQTLGMKVLAHDPYHNAGLETTTCTYASLEDILVKSDVIVLHCPLLPSTKGIINKENINKMKNGVLIINNSRGLLVVEEDLRDALNSGKVAGAACDVISVEPIRADNPLLEARNIIITPHISWAAKESRKRLMKIATDNLEAFLGGNSQNVVNKYDDILMQVSE